MPVLKTDLHLISSIVQLKVFGTFLCGYGIIHACYTRIRACVASAWREFNRYPHGKSHKAARSHSVNWKITSNGQRRNVVSRPRQDKVRETCTKVASATVFLKNTWNEINQLTRNWPIFNRQLRVTRDCIGFAPTCTETNVENQRILCTNQITGGSCSSCEMIILRNDSHDEIIRVCVGMFTTAIRNK